MPRFRHDLCGANIPVLIAAGRRSEATASIWARLLESGNRVYCGHAYSILSRYRCDSARTEHTELMKRLQIRLDAGATTRIATGDRQSDWWRVVQPVIGLSIFSVVHSERSQLVCY